MGNKVMQKFEYKFGEKLYEAGAEKDLGVIIDKKLNFEDHLAEKVNKANKLVGIIRTFVALDEIMFKNLFTALVRPHLKYANQVWSIYKSKVIKIIENIQRRATKLIPTLKTLTCEERLRKSDLPTLVYRIARRDMIETKKFE